MIILMSMYNYRIVISSEESTPQSSGEEGDHAASNQEADHVHQSDWVDPTAIHGNPMLVMKIQRLVASVNICVIFL